MSSSQHSSIASPWKRTRYWTTLACVTALLAGLLTLAEGHPLHGWLMILGGLVLTRGTVWGRRGRRSGQADLLADGAKASAASRKWKKAA